MKHTHNDTIPCPCHSQKPYSECCLPFHKGEKPPTALQLMRSRYAAYAYNLPDYIIQTTHPASPQYSVDRQLWKKKISEFSKGFQFDGLEILDVKEGANIASVTFVAHMRDNDQDATFTEKSFFEKNQGTWLYRTGRLSSGHTPNMITTEPLRIHPLAYYGETVLRQKALPIEKITDDVRTLIEEMIETMDAGSGVGLAAPQIHHSIRLFVIRTPHENTQGNFDLGEPQVFINPVLSSPSEETWTVSEGCLSVPSIHGNVTRPKEITITYNDIDFHTIQRRVSGWEARVIMHENDHLNGMYFFDRVEKGERQKIQPLIDHLQERIHDMYAL